MREFLLKIQILLLLVHIEMRSQETATFTQLNHQYDEGMNAATHDAVDQLEAFRNSDYTFFEKESTATLREKIAGMVDEMEKLMEPIK